MNANFKNAKDTLVALLFELSKAAQDAAVAAVDFYRFSGDDAATSAIISQLQSHNPPLLSQSLSSATAQIQALGSNLLRSIPILASGIDGSADTPSSQDELSTKKEKPLKKKKVEKDPNAPKKPLTIYFAYAFHTREQIRLERKEKLLPPLPAAEVNEIVKDRWNSITAQEKSYWQEQYASQLKEYQDEKEKYQNEKKGQDGNSTKQSCNDKDKSPFADAEDKIPETPLQDLNKQVAEQVADLISGSPQVTERKKEKKRKAEKKDRVEKKKKPPA